MKRLIYLCILLMCSISAQSADKLYDEGKKLYDQEQYKEAVPKLQAAADKGHRKAQYRLGRCYDKGYGVKENDQKAFELYQKSAKQDYAKRKGEAANQQEASTSINPAISDEKHGDEILKDLRKAKADGEEATRILTLIGKNK